MKPHLFLLAAVLSLIPAVCAAEDAPAPDQEKKIGGKEIKARGLTNREIIRNKQEKKSEVVRKLKLGVEEAEKKGEEPAAGTAAKIRRLELQAKKEERQFNQADDAFQRSQRDKEALKRANRYEERLDRKKAAELGEDIVPEEEAAEQEAGDDAEPATNRERILKKQQDKREAAARLKKAVEEGKLSPAEAEARSRKLELQAKKDERQFKQADAALQRAQRNKDALKRANRYEERLKKKKAAELGE